MYDKDVHKYEDCIYKVVGSGNKITEVVVKQSNYHIIIEPNNNNFDRYLIQYIVKEYAKREPLDVFNTKKSFKTVLINYVDNLSYYAQTSLRRTMEKYSSTCRFIMACHSLSQVIEPLKSRCMCIRISSPSYTELFKRMLHICAYENVNLSLEQYTKILNQSKGNIKKILWNIQLIQAGLSYDNMYINTIKDIAKTIAKYKLEDLYDIRTLLYNIMITNVPSTEIIRDIMLEISKNKNIPISIKFKIIESASKYEHNLTRGRHDIIHLLGFVSDSMKLITKS
jgi:replication factor C subunit 3/5